MTDERTVQALSQRYGDALRAAEARHFIRVAEANRLPRPGLGARALAQVGRRLVALGQQLEARYGLPPAFGLDASMNPNISKYQQ